ncbi:gluconolactonase [Paenibacillus sp. FSL H8-0457]|uniref:gluconolactonase n=1 Tax=unclassified Paenibacillus TaxID=185978 RepID=UPI0003E1F085|nr:gluconolactonase [Paenibacillus sp. FSL H8-457]ETT64572.1 NHL repeat containing protein [Paenibacillus sp. FSL H8-457]
MSAKKWLLTLAAASLLLPGLMPGSVSASAPYESYIYNYWEETVAVPAAYLPERAVTGKELGIGDFLDPSDMHVSEAGNIYVLDSGNKRIVVLDDAWNVIRVIDSFMNEGKEDGFANPAGIFIDGDEQIYVADTDHQRVVVLTAEGALVRIMEQPESDVLPQGFQFIPLKVAVDEAKRVFVVARGVYEGIMQFEEEGTFLGYVGTIKVKRDYGDYFWRLVSTSAQKAQMRLFIPTEFSNLDMDGKGFVYATNIDVGSREPLKRLNPSGEDVLKRFGYFPVAGDIYYRRTVGPSKFVDIKVLGDGMYSALDSTQGRVFTYDETGNLLYVYGGIGNQLGLLKTPAAIERLGDRQLVLDRGKASIVMFEPTEFGKQVNLAVRHHYRGEDAEAERYWERVLQLNANYDIAYIGIGKAKLMKGENKEALQYFELGMDRKNYSVAYKRYRREVMKEHFGTFLSAGTGGLLLYAVYRTVRYRKQRRAGKHEAGLS